MDGITEAAWRPSPTPGSERTGGRGQEVCMNLNSWTEDLFWGLQTRQRGSIPDHHLAGLISPSLKGEVKAASG